MTSRSAGLGWLFAVVAAGCASAPPAPRTTEGAAASTTATSASAPATSSAPSAPAPAASAPSPAPSASAAAPAGTKPSTITARHVLIQYMGAQHAASSVVRTKEQAYQVAQEVLRQARAGDDFARLAIEYSDEPGAGQRGGSLGKFGHGQMVHEFEDAAFSLAPGQISGIVETPFGYHIIQRLE